MSYIGQEPGLGVREIFVYTATAGQTVFSGNDDNGLFLNYTVGQINVHVNGVLLVDTTDYTATNGTSVTFVSALAVNDVVSIEALGAFSPADTYTQAAVDSLVAGKVAKTGDTMSGALAVDPTTGRQLVTAAWGELSGSDGGQGLLGGNLYVDKTASVVKSSITHASLGGAGVIFNHPSWNKHALIASGSTSSTAGATVTPVVALQWDSNGYVTTPKNPYFAAYRSAALTTVAGTITLYPYDTVSTDNGSNFNLTGSKFTAPVSGLYSFKAHIATKNTASATGYIQLRFYANGSAKFYSGYHNFATGYQSLHAACDLYLSAGDYVQVYYQTQYAAPLVNGITYLWFQGHLVG